MVPIFVFPLYNLLFKWLKKAYTQIFQLIFLCGCKKGGESGKHNRWCKQPETYLVCRTKMASSKMIRGPFIYLKEKLIVEAIHYILSSIFLKDSLVLIEHLKNNISISLKRNRV